MSSKVYSRSQIVVVRERLIALFYRRRLSAKHHAYLGGKYTIRDLLCDIIYSDEKFLEGDTDDFADEERPYDFHFPIKDDNIGRFLTRKQGALAAPSLSIVIRYLIDNELLTQLELEQLYRTDTVELPIQTKVQSNEPRCEMPDGEYVALNFGQERFRLSQIVFSKDRTKKTTRTAHRELYTAGFGGVNRDLQIVKKEAYYKRRPTEGNSRIFEDILAGVVLYYENCACIIAFNLREISISSMMFTDITDESSFLLDNNSNYYVIFSNLNSIDQNIVNFVIHTFEGAAVRDTSVSKRVERSSSDIDSDIDSDIYFPDFIWKTHGENYVPVKITWKTFLFGDRMKDKDFKDKELDRELLDAARNGDDFAVLQMLIEGADIDAVDIETGNNVLHFAAMNKSYALLEILSGKIEPHHSYLTPFAESISDGIRPLKSVFNKIAKAVEFAPICKKNMLGQTPSVCITNAIPGSSNEQEQEAFRQFLRALERELQDYGGGPNEFINYFTDCKALPFGL